MQLPEFSLPLTPHFLSWDENSWRKEICSAVHWGYHKSRLNCPVTFLGISLLVTSVYFVVYRTKSLCSESCFLHVQEGHYFSLHYWDLSPILWSTSCWNLTKKKKRKIKKTWEWVFFSVSCLDSTERFLLSGNRYSIKSPLLLYNLNAFSTPQTTSSQTAGVD